MSYAETLTHTYIHPFPHTHMHTNMHTPLAGRSMVLGNLTPLQKKMQKQKSHFGTEEIGREICLNAFESSSRVEAGIQK